MRRAALQKHMQVTALPLFVGGPVLSYKYRKPPCGAVRTQYQVSYYLSSSIAIILMSPPRKRPGHGGAEARTRAHSSSARYSTPPASPASPALLASNESPRKSTDRSSSGNSAAAPSSARPHPSLQMPFSPSKPPSSQKSVPGTRPCNSCSYIYAYSASPSRSYSELGAAAERELVTRTMLSPVLLTSNDWEPYSMARNYPEKNARIPVLAVVVGWNDIISAAAPKGGSKEASSSMASIGGLKMRAHVALLDADQLRRCFEKQPGKQVVRLPGPSVEFRSGARLSRRHEVICFIDLS